MSRHRHHHHHGSLLESRPSRLTLMVLIPAALITIAAMFVLWPSEQEVPREAGEPPQRVAGVVTAVDREPCPKVPGGGEQPGGKPVNGCGSATVRVSEGPDLGKKITAQLPSGPGAPVIAESDHIMLMHLADSAAGQEYQIIDHQRDTSLWLLLGAFALAVVAFGRWRGLAALAGLGITFGVLLIFIVPAILDGQPPLLIAIVGSAAIMLTVLYLTHGLSVSTSVAVLGTLISLVLTGVLSAVAVSAAHLTGVADEQSTYLGMNLGVNMQGLLLAGILIGSLGVLDDVTVTQAATVEELARANPRYGFTHLYVAATRVGRAHIASVINTIVLAYAGASLPLLILIAAGNNPLGQILTTPLIAQELVRSAVGTLGLIAAVPITTALAALAVTRIPPQLTEPPGAEPGPAQAYQDEYGPEYAPGLHR
ncbi:MAG: YibE/F family protein [Micromonosporaceae bacterium]